MTDTPDIHLAHDAHVTRITVHNPAKRNAVNHVMWRALGDALETVHADPDLRVVILTGAGDKAFCAGNDISEFKTWRDDPRRHREYDDTARRAMTLLRTAPVPVIARIRGVCVGGGLELALACDFRLATHDARFAITPARLGLGYTLDDVSLVVDTVGAAVARRLLFTAAMLDAAEAQALGIVDSHHPVAGLDPAVDELAAVIAGNAPLTVRALKAAIGEAVKPEARRDRARVQSLVDACHRSADYQEGQRAFAARRAPRFSGR